MIRATSFVGVLLCISAAGCLSLRLDDHIVRCHASSPACPDGYFCGADGYCYANGHTPPALDMTAATKRAGDACTLSAVAGDTSSNPQVFAVGEKVYSRNGTTWNQITQTLPSRLSSITWELGLGTIFVAGGLDGNIYKSDYNGIFSKVYGTGWSQVNGIWGSGANYYVVGAAGGIAHGDRNDNWATQSSGTSNTLRSVYGVSDSGQMTFNYYAVGDNGTIVFSTGNGSWSAQTSNTTATLTGVWGSGLNDIYAVGYDSGAGAGIVMHLK